jgi:hypothetical protein
MDGRELRKSDRTSIFQRRLPLKIRLAGGFERYTKPRQLSEFPNNSPLTFPFRALRTFITVACQNSDFKLPKSISFSFSKVIENQFRELGQRNVCEKWRSLEEIP